MGTAAQKAMKDRTHFAIWSDEFSVGIDEIDRDHRKLFELLTKLHDASHAGTRREELGKVLDEVLHYLCYHFAHEEELLLQTNFPGYEKHRRLHQAMIGMIEEICKDFQSGAPEPLPERVPGVPEELAL